MTLVAIFRPEAPIIISDVLLSHLNQPRVSITPTGRFIHPMSGKEVYQPHSFSQKTVLLDEDRAIFIGSGDVSTLKFLATDLRSEIRNGMKRDGLEAWMNKRNGRCGKTCLAMISWCDDDGVTTAKMGVGVRAFPFRENSTVFCGGSGSDWLKRNLIREMTELERVGVFDEHEMVRFLAVGQTAQHIGQERFLGVRHNFGGGFQITYYDGDRFVPVRKVAYLVFTVEHGEDGPGKMTLSGPLVMQHWDGSRLSFELWIPEHELFETAGDHEMLQSRNRVMERVVPTLLYSRPVSVPIEDLSNCEHVNAQVIHLKDGKPIGCGSFQLVGDAKLSDVTLSGAPNENMTVSIPKGIFAIWSTRYDPIGHG